MSDCFGGGRTASADTFLVLLFIYLLNVFLSWIIDHHPVGQQMIYLENKSNAKRDACLFYVVPFNQFLSIRRI